MTGTTQLGMRQYIELLEYKLLVKCGYFTWGQNAWIHESDEGTVLTRGEALEEVITGARNDL